MLPSQCSYLWERWCIILPPILVIYPLNILYTSVCNHTQPSPKSQAGSAGSWHSPHPRSLPGLVSTFYFVPDSGHVSQQGEYSGMRQSLDTHGDVWLGQRPLEWALLTLTQGLYSVKPLWPRISCTCPHHLSQWRHIPQSPHGTHSRERDNFPFVSLHYSHQPWRG